VFAPDPAPPSFDPALEKLDRRQLEQLLDEVSPDVFYVRAAALDHAAAQLAAIADSLRYESRRLSDHWTGEVEDSFQDAARRLADRMDAVVDAMSVPGYGQAMKNAGDALALAQQRLRAGDDQPVQPGSVPLDPAAIDQGAQQSALQILRDLCTAYYDIGRGLVPLPEPGSGPASGPGEVTGGGPQPGGGPGTDSGYPGYSGPPDETGGHQEGFGVSNVFPPGVFGSPADGGSLPGEGRRGSSHAGSGAAPGAFADAHGDPWFASATPSGVSADPSGDPWFASATTPGVSADPHGDPWFASATSTGAATGPHGKRRFASAAPSGATADDEDTGAFAAMPLWGTSAAIGKPGVSSSRRSKKAAAARRKPAVTEAGAPEEVSTDERPATVSAAQVASTRSEPWGAPASSAAPAVATASTGSAASASAGPAAHGTASVENVIENVTASSHPATVPAAAGNTAAGNAAAVSAAHQQIASILSAPEALRPHLPEGGAAAAGALSPVRPLADLTAARLPDGSSAVPGAGLPGGGSSPAGGSTSAGGMPPGAPMMFGGLPGHDQTSERVPDVPFGAASGVWGFDDGVSPVLGKGSARVAAARTEPGGPAAPPKQDDLQQLLEREILGRIQGRKPAED
jgi:uncharacterized protein YukE